MGFPSHLPPQYTYGYEKVIDDAIELQDLNQPNRDVRDEERRIQFQLHIDNLLEEQRIRTEQRRFETALARRQRRVKRGTLFRQTVTEWGLGALIGFGIFCAILVAGGFTWKYLSSKSETQVSVSVPLTEAPPLVETRAVEARVASLDSFTSSLPLDCPPCPETPDL
ncbi:hypothetical protein VC83_01976 [Pseudogymnoascus destructans]|uniref:Uncharacterized protein n=2 Tax=Pseudogymnoascus destructans TaxID=655981 RepID=L8FXM9_PSED2|nr:uncharacterized protein VC83_01976 [Pseudogymnoascus destructans]ELR04461.1 hypothetical protein GMDG_06767 [Pseudogymnoascus destructans 20631-21]OAF61493.1 hypothetical protein VC83_01976 [Pseudogymnoascus destructans]